ncbi:MraY family glycosyltransferase [Roseinatronobacter sp.]|uniref:MraY family glycosyltransferase n=1 Tax=Roseinatronobacter sp. TaxID=1945755 RepID=UPI0025DFEB0B|nr:glycosyltransferase [Roseibaca sp.]
MAGAAGIFLFAIPIGVDPALKLLFLSVLPIFLAGLAEDFGLHLSPKVRLTAAALASLLAAALLGQWVTRADIPGLDLALAIPVIGLVVTAIGGAGVSHSFNLIDGVNGLSSGVAAVAALGLAVIAHQAGESTIAFVALLLVAAILGFMVFNWPFGAIFLGDAGAYSLGHILGWLGILLVARVPEISMLAITGLFFWPLADTFFAIYRRRRIGRPTDQPDRLHFHQLVMRGLEITMIGREKRHIANPLTTALLLPLIALGIFGHVLLWDNPLGAIALWGVQGTVFVLLYLTGLRTVNARRKPKRQSSKGGDLPLPEQSRG